MAANLASDWFLSGVWGSAARPGKDRDGFVASFEASAFWPSPFWSTARDRRSGWTALWGGEADDLVGGQCKQVEHQMAGDPRIGVRAGPVGPRTRA